MALKIIFSLFLLLFSLASVKAASLNVVISEIAWMGTTQSVNNEWIELYNNTDKEIDLDGWVLKTADEKLKISLKNKIPSKGFFLLERTDDSALPEISADLIYKGALGNNGENLLLYDGLNNLIDEVDNSNGWFAGDNSAKKTMGRINSEISGNQKDNWQTSQNTGGTPKSKNSSVEARPLPPTSVPPPIFTEDWPLQTISAEDSPPLTYSGGIIFSEVLPSPKGKDEEEEWIEIFNQNDFEINLAGWRIKDAEGKTANYIFPQNTKIPSKGYLVLKRPETKITLNNTGDGLFLLHPNNNVIDSVSFGKTPQNQSWSKIKDKWLWNLALTPGKGNVLPPSPSQSPENKNAVSKANLENNLFSEKMKAQASKSNNNLNKSPDFSSAILIAVFIALFSGIIIFVFKKSFVEKMDKQGKI